MLDDPARACGMTEPSTAGRRGCLRWWSGACTTRRTAPSYAPMFELDAAPGLLTRRYSAAACQSERPPYPETTPGRIIRH